MVLEDLGATGVVKKDTLLETAPVVAGVALAAINAEKKGTWPGNVQITEEEDIVQVVESVENKDTLLGNAQMEMLVLRETVVESAGKEDTLQESALMVERGASVVVDVGNVEKKDTLHETARTVAVVMLVSVCTQS